MSGLFKIKFSELSPLTKVAVTWAGWATACLTGYYFARRWSHNQRVESLEIRKAINNEFIVRLDEAAALVEAREKSVSDRIKREK